MRQLTHLAIAALALAACSRADNEHSAAVTTDSTTIGSAVARGDTVRAAHVKTIEGFKTPESAKYDEAADVWYVSNINGQPTAKDGNGYISRVTADGVVDSAHFIMGGRGGVILNGPKGIAIIGDTLFVADIDAVRAFNKTTGAPFRSWYLAKQGANFLNDVVATPSGDVYITDTEIKFNADGSVSHTGTDRVFMLARDRKSAQIAVQSDELGRPNGIAWDAKNNRLIVVPFGAGVIHAVDPTGKAALATVAQGKGQFDGIEVLPDGRIFVTSWADSSVSVVTGDSLVHVIGGMEAPADIGFDSKRMLLAIPLFNAGKVEVWRIGKAQ
jgi:sugar lactone lactonase YvrE